MARTQQESIDILDGAIKRSDTNSTETGEAICEKVLPGVGVGISSTGVDSGTGDVTVNNTAPKITTITTDSGSFTATGVSDAVDITGGTNISTSMVGSTLTIEHTGANSGKTNTRVTYKNGATDDIPNNLYGSWANAHAAALGYVTVGLTVDLFIEPPTSGTNQVISGAWAMDSINLEAGPQYFGIGGVTLTFANGASFTFPTTSGMRFAGSIILDNSGNNTHVIEESKTMIVVFGDGARIRATSGVEFMHVPSGQFQVVSNRSATFSNGGVAAIKADGSLQMPAIFGQIDANSISGTGTLFIQSDAGTIFSNLQGATVSYSVVRNTEVQGGVNIRGLGVMSLDGSNNLNLGEEANSIISEVRARIGGVGAPIASVHSSGSYAGRVFSTTGHHTISDNDFIVSMDVSGGSSRLTLPLASTLPGFSFILIKSDSSANLIKAIATPSDTLNGVTTAVDISGQNAAYILTNDGVDKWFTSSIGSGGAFLPLDGSQAMTGDLDFGLNNIVNVNKAVISNGLEIPSSAAPSMLNDGDLGVDTSVTDFADGVLKYFGGQEMAAIAVPATGLVTPSQGDVPTYNSLLDRFELSQPAPPAQTNMSYFKATKNGTQSTTGTFTDLTGWDQDAAGSDFTFNTTTGILTFNTSALYQVIVDVHGTMPGNNRHTSLVRVQEDTGTGFTNNPELYWRSYSARNNAHNEGGINSTYLKEYSAGDQIKILVADLQEPLNINTDDARFYAVKLIS